MAGRTVVLCMVVLATLPAFHAQDNGFTDEAVTDSNVELTSSQTTSEAPTTQRWTSRTTAFRDKLVVAPAPALAGKNGTQMAPLQAATHKATPWQKASVSTKASTTRRTTSTTTTATTTASSTTTSTTTADGSTTASGWTLAAAQGDMFTDSGMTDMMDSDQPLAENHGFASNDLTGNYSREPKIQSDQNSNFATPHGVSPGSQANPASSSGSEKGQFIGFSELGYDDGSGQLQAQGQAFGAQSQSEATAEAEIITTTESTTTLAPSTTKKTTKAKPSTPKAKATLPTKPTPKKALPVTKPTMTTTTTTTTMPSTTAAQVLDEAETAETNEPVSDTTTTTRKTTASAAPVKTWTPWKPRPQPVLTVKVATTAAANQRQPGNARSIRLGGESNLAARAPVQRMAASSVTSTTAAASTTLPDSEYYDDITDEITSVSSTTTSTTTPTTTTTTTTTSRTTPSTATTRKITPTTSSTTTTRASTTRAAAVAAAVKANMASTRKNWGAVVGKASATTTASPRQPDNARSIRVGGEKNAIAAPVSRDAAIASLAVGNSTEPLLDGSYLSDPWMCRIKRGVVRSPVVMETCNGKQREVVDLRVYKLVGIPTEECVKDPVALGDRCTSLNGGKARCAQRYVRYGLIAKDTASDKKGHECFRFPSACLCQLIVDGQTPTEEPDGVAKEP